MGRLAGFTAAEVIHKLRRAGFEFDRYAHGSHEIWRNPRERVMADFRSGAVSILVATNVAARGLDVSGIEQVINYELPDTAQLFTHRVGRTGRMGREGEAITFVTPDDNLKWRQIERELGHSSPRKTWWPNGQGASTPARTSASVAKPPVRLSRPSLNTA